jgi:hypothetical protein
MADKPKRVQLKDLAAATKASVQAAVGKELLQSLKPGVLTGLLLDNEQLATLERTPIELAREIAKGVNTASGIRVTPGVQKLPEAVLVGYLVPRISRS